jgi:transcriptional regulator NrdR family protein
VFSKNGVRRRRQCDECGRRFTTIEVVYHRASVEPSAILESEVCQ